MGSATPGETTAAGKALLTRASITATAGQRMWKTIALDMGNQQARSQMCKQKIGARR